MLDDLKQVRLIAEQALAPSVMTISPAMFAGKLVADESDPERPWLYLEVEQGIPKSAFEALQLSGVPCEARYDSPHITVTKNDETLEIIKRFGKEKWKEYVLSGPEQYAFTIHEMVDVDPDGWDEMDRVWFLRCESPAVIAKRIALDLTPLPNGDDGEPQNLHITVAVRPAAEVVTESQRTRDLIQETLLG